MNQDNDKKQQNSEPSVNPDIVKMGFFDGDNDAFYIYKKTEKIVTAIYMLTNLFPDDPLKMSLRESSLSLLSHSILFSDKVGSDKRSVFDIITTGLVEIISKVEVSFFAGMMSSMNHAILRKEVESLLSYLEHKGRQLGFIGHIVLDKNFFGEEKTITDTTTLNTTQSLLHAQENYKGHSIGHIKSHSGNHALGANQISKDGKLNKGHKESDPKKSKSDRADMIINLLKKKDSLMIKDFSAVIKDCSEKTIQRELLSLVAKGVLKKEGERRWSKYSLK